MDVAAALDAPLVLVVDARERGATAAAAACGARMLAGDLEFAGAIVVGGDDPSPAGELRRILEETARLPGARLAAASAQRAVRAPLRQAARVALRQIGPQPVKGGEAGSVPGG